MVIVGPAAVTGILEVALTVIARIVNGGSITPGGVKTMGLVDTSGYIGSMKGTKATVAGPGYWPPRRVDPIWVRLYSVGGCVRGTRNANGYILGLRQAFCR